MATIIKKEMHVQSSGKSLHAVAYDLTDMAEQAESYVENVRREATKIIQTAKQEAIAIREKAEKEGRKAARAAIEHILDQKVEKQMQTLVPALNSAIAQIEDSKQQWLHHWETAAVKLAAAIAQRLIRRELTEHPELSLEWISSALELAAGSTEVTVRLHPDDHETLRSEVVRLADLFCPLASAKIVADDSITASGCRVETQFGSIDQQIETQLARVVQELT